MRSSRLKSVFAALAIAAGLGSPLALAQGTVPPQLLENNRPLQGDAIRFCVDSLSPGAAFDTAVANAIADALLVEATVNVAPGGFSLDAVGYLDELQLVMTQTCDVIMGISLQPNNPYPQWASVTRPYASVPFVLAVTDPAFQNLADIPRELKIGTAIGSLGEATTIAYISQLPKDQRWRRLPYADPELMKTRLLDGTLAGMVIWQPVLNQITGGDPASAGLRVISMAPVPDASVALGALVSNRDQFLRELIDEGIAALIDDGEMESIMDEHGYAGVPGG